MKNISFRAYHLLWKLMRKRVMHIEGEDIEYVLLPWWLLISREAKHFFCGSMRIVHIPSKTVMIFVCMSEIQKDRRYTIYHEHIEGYYTLRKGFAETQESLVGAVQCASDEIIPDAPSLDDKLNEFLRRTDDRAHIVALLLELHLMKKELSYEEYHTQIKYALENRL